MECHLRTNMMHERKPTYSKLTVEIDDRCFQTLRKAALFMERMKGHEVSIEEALEEILIHTRGGIRLLQNVTNNWRDLET